MKNIRFKAINDRRTRILEPSDLERLGVSDPADKQLVWGPDNGQVLEVANDVAEVLTTVLPNEFEEVDSAEVEQAEEEEKPKGKPRKKKDEDQKAEGTSKPPSPEKVNESHASSSEGGSPEDAPDES